MRWLDGADAPAPDVVIDRQLRELKAQIPTLYLGVAVSTAGLAILFPGPYPGISYLGASLFVAVVLSRIVSWKKLDVDLLSSGEKRARIDQIAVFGAVFSLICNIFVFSFHFIAAPGQRIVLLAYVVFCAITSAMSLVVSKRACRVTSMGVLLPYCLFNLASGDLALTVIAAGSLAGVPIAIQQYGRMANFVARLSIEEAEAARLRQMSDKMLRSFIETASDWAWERDRNGLLTYVSEGLADFGGVPREELIGTDVRQLYRLFKMERTPNEAEYAKLVAERKPYTDLVYSFRDPEGERKWMTTTGQPRFDETGEFLGYVGWTKDITKEVLAEKRIKDSEQRFRHFAESASDWWWEADAECRYTYVSERATHSTGIDRTQFIGQPMGCRIDPEEFPQHEEFQRAVAAHEPFKDIIVYIPGEAKGAWVTLSGKPVFDENGVFLGYRGAGRNVTLRIEAETAAREARKALEEANSRLEATVEERTRALRERTTLLDEVFETMAEGLLVIDADLRIVARNSKAWKFSELPEESWQVGANILPIVDAYVRRGAYDQATTVEEFLTQRKAALAAGKPIVSLRRLDSGAVIQEDIRPRTGGGAVVTFTDITDLKMRQDQLEALSAELGAAKDEAIAANRAKSDFLANMSHEIRTPMNGVVGMASLLLETNLSTKQHEMAQVIVSSGENLLKIINDILDFSRLEAGKLKIVSEPFDLRAAIEDVASLLSLRIEQKGLKFFVRYQPALGEKFIGDAGRLRQVITNLVGNAVKFTEEGHIMLDVTGKRRGEIAEIEIAVKDTGCGIPEEKLTAIFEEFEQVDNSSARRFDGAGLGLAISRGIVEAMGGKISVESTFGEGSTFRVTIPMRIDEEAIAPKAPSRDALKGLRALIVDDNAVSRAILVELLSSWGVSTVPVQNGGLALAAARNAAMQGQAFQLAIFDHRMPGDDGVDLARRFRNEKALAMTPLILLTSAGRKGEPSAGIMELFDAYLVKPARASTLLDTIASCLSESSVRQLTAVTSEARTAEPEQAPHCPFTPNGTALDVLVAEDNIVNQMVIKAMLEKLGCTVRIAGNGREVVTEYNKREPSLVLMDISMPEVDGFEATSLIRAIQEQGGRRAAIIGVTAHAMREDRKRCLDAGMDDHLPKPVKREALMEVLNRWAPKEEARKVAGGF
ncbi:MAG TPA: response regulator [Parvularculaceae bacterium]|nr:response regulator [Parvularculaceae bacterium]